MKSLRILAAALMVLSSATAFAQQMQDNPECLGDACGKPKEEGGGCGCGCGCSVWVAYTDDGDTLAYADDADGDGKADPRDNCPFAANRDQAESDGDQVGDACDNCPAVSNKEQADTDGDGQGDLCDTDLDGDGVLNAADNCPAVANKDQKNSRKGAATDPCAGKGDACCEDADGDGEPNATDTCPTWANPNQADRPADAGLCKADADGDGVADAIDNCVDVANADQKDTDNDKLGDACDADQDGDGILNAADNCAVSANKDQVDADKDGKGDACDPSFCFVVDAASPDACLNPKAPFAVAAGGKIQAEKGQSVRLPLFANRNNVAIEFQWTVTKRPEGSSAAISSPRGSVSASRDWQYAYPNGEVPTFVADADGDYEFQLAATLVSPDRVYPDKREATATAKLAAGGGTSPDAGGCSAAFGAPLIPLALLGLAAIWRRRQ